MHCSDSKLAEQFLTIIYFSEITKTLLNLSSELKNEQMNTHFCLKASQNHFSK